jgi:hypothetical protein
MTPISASTRLSRASDFLPAELDGELLLMDIDQGKYFGFKGTARRVWDLVDPPCNFGELCDHLRAQYRATPGRIESDVMVFVDKLVQQKLLILS